MSDTEKDPREIAIQEQFFSRTDPREHADIYLVRNLPQEIKATLNGLYSRSHLSMRDTFLKRLRQGLEDAGKTLADFPLESTGEHALGEFLVDRSGKFLRTYAIDHGHNSLREGAVLHIAIENVSQLVTRFIQRERRASFEESSTRYISFRKEGHWRDPEIQAAGGEWSALYEEALGESFGFYGEAIEALREHIARMRPLEEGEDEKAWKRAVRAEALDNARYLLTPALFTKFGIIADARTVSDLCTQLLSHPLEEFQIVGARMLEEAQKDIPTLLAHAKANPYLEAQHARFPDLARSQEPGKDTHSDSADAPAPTDASVSLLSWPEDPDARLLASALYESSTKSYASLLEKAKGLSSEERAALFEALLKERGPRDAMPEGIEGAGLFEFEILMDFGAFRDIARHRKGFQQQQALTTRLGYAMPELFVQAGLAERYQSVLSSVANKVERLRDRFPTACAYLIPFAFLQRIRVQFDTRQLAYFLELRSSPEGHFSYRDIAIRMGKELAKRAPLYARWIRLCEESVFLGRVETEKKRDTRRAARMARAEELGFET